MIDEAEAAEDAPAADDASFAAAGTLREILDLALDNVDAGPERLAAWNEIRQARADRSPVVGRLVLTLDDGVFMRLDTGIYGYAPRHELPAWIPRRPHAECVGRELACAVVGIDGEARMVLLSPRLLALRQARAALGDGGRISGHVISTRPEGVVVDLGGARGFAPFHELDLDELLSVPEPDAAWSGYVTACTDTGVLLARRPADARARRARERQRLLAQLAPGRHTDGLVVRTAGDGALIAVGEGLAWGRVPRAALRSPLGERLIRGSAASFRIVGRDEDEPVQLALWPRPAR